MLYRFAGNAARILYYTLMKERVDDAARQR
jgi:hypothetical protein